jgi:cell division initiation protein
MTYTPVELRHARIGRGLLGYNRTMVDQIIDEVADSFETAWRERGELSDQVHALETQVRELKGREDLLANTLVAAEQAASGLREQARREAEVILAEAHYEARSIVRTAEGERQRLFTEARRVEAMLRTALGIVHDEHAAPQAALAPAAVEPVKPAAPAEAVHPASQVTKAVEPAPAPVAAAEPASPGGWPIEEVPEARRQDTREFTPITLPPVELDELQVEVPEPRIGQFVGGESRNFDWGD